MRPFITILLSFFWILSAFAKEVKDTILTTEGDKIILAYDISYDNQEIRIDFSRPRVIPSASLKNACSGEFDKIKVVFFDRIGDFGNTKWGGLTPTAFMVPSDLAYDKSPEGFYILGESQPLELTRLNAKKSVLKIPLYVAVYGKKKNYRIVTSSRQPLTFTISNDVRNSGYSSGEGSPRAEDRITVISTEEIESENGDITSALSSIALIKELLERETEVPFSQTLQMEIYNLRSMKNQIKEPEVVDKINEVLVLCSDKELELKKSQNQSELAARAQEQALIQQQKQEAEAQQLAAEEKARQQEEKQQKRTIWMIIGAAILGVLGFIGNGIFKHYRDVANQRNILEMQESLARQAQHEAGRRSREIVRNKAHQMANKGRSKLRETLNNTRNDINSRSTNNNNNDNNSRSANNTRNDNSSRNNSRESSGQNPKNNKRISI